jgi:hypothetical protein
LSQHLISGTPHLLVGSLAQILSGRHGRRDPEGCGIV